MLNRRFVLQGIIQLPLLGLLPGCDEKAHSHAKALKPVALHNGDECAVCGMLIQRFPGPKGEALDPQGNVLKFCSTLELLTWWLQPENQHLPLTLYVHDMAHSDWQHPDDNAFINAREAWYVTSTDLLGSMGPTLASFSQQTDAHQFSISHGGKVLTFAELNLQALSSLMSEKV